MSVEIDLRIEASAWSDAISDVEDLCARALEAGAAVAKAAGEIDVLLTDATEMTSLNAAWRGKNRPTDVLSFPADPIDAPHLGSVAIGFSTAKSDAAADGKSLDEHLAHLL
ncbi:MAG: rRNA maturation RNase YbeY, partial [Pseudomonadota bacterium]